MDNNKTDKLADEVVDLINRANIRYFMKKYPSYFEKMNEYTKHDNSDKNVDYEKMYKLIKELEYQEQIKQMEQIMKLAQWAKNFMIDYLQPINIDNNNQTNNINNSLDDKPVEYTPIPNTNLPWNPVYLQDKPHNK